MIISRTPLRISFVGGGTDIASFYRHYGGAVISTTIDKYISVCIIDRRNRRFAINTPNYHEEVADLNQIQHPLIREAVRKTDTAGISITVTSDVPVRGCGLGSSSALTVGLLNAFYAYRGITMPAETLAQQACEIEIERLNQPIGRQDQYITAYGGLRQIQFNSDESVYTQELPVTGEKAARLERNLMLFYTGLQRRAETILHEQKRSASPQTLLKLKKLVPQFYNLLVKDSHENHPYEIGYLLDCAWQLKRSLCDSVSSPKLDAIYARAIAAGALGGKLLGAGGGGYFLFYVPTERQQAVTATLSHLGLSRLVFRFEQKGSQVIEGRNLIESHYPYRRERYTTQAPHFRVS